MKKTISASEKVKKSSKTTPVTAAATNAVATTATAVTVPESKTASNSIKASANSKQGSVSVASAKNQKAVSTSKTDKKVVTNSARIENSNFSPKVKMADFLPMAKSAKPVSGRESKNLLGAKKQNEKPDAEGKTLQQNMSKPVNQRRYEMTFNNYLIYLLNMLHELEALQYPSIKEYLDQTYLRYSKLADNERIQDYLLHIYERFQPHIKLIAEQDDFLFSADYNNKGELKLISGLPLHEIWQFLDALEHTMEFEESEDPALPLSVEKAMKLKKCIWDSLLNLYVSCCLALNRGDDPWAVSILQNLRLARQLEKEIEEEVVEDENNGTGLPNIADFEKIFNSDNAFSQIIKDIGTEINPEEYMRALNPENKPPLEMIMGLFSGTNPTGLQNIAESLTEKFNTKMKERGYTPEDLTIAANDMKKDLSKIPGLGGLLSQINTDIVFPSNCGQNDTEQGLGDQNGGGAENAIEGTEQETAKNAAEFGTLFSQALASNFKSENLADRDDVPPEMKSMFDMLRNMQDQVQQQSQPGTLDAAGQAAVDQQQSQHSGHYNQEGTQEYTQGVQYSSDDILAERNNQPSVD
jgi:hypothetical protein